MHEGAYILEFNSVLYRELFQRMNGASKLALTDYQQKIQKYFLNDTDHCMLLLYMEVGTGKTMTSISCGIAGIEAKLFDHIVILSPKAVQDEFVRNLEFYWKIRGNKPINKGFILHMIPYNAGNSFKQLLRLKKQLGTFERTLFIIDEAHLFFKSVIKVQLSPDDTSDNTLGNNLMRDSLGDVLMNDTLNNISTSNSSTNSSRIFSTNNSLSNYLSNISTSNSSSINSSTTSSSKPSTSNSLSDSLRTTSANTHKQLYGSSSNVGNAKHIYDLIRRLKNKRVICLTGTPSAKHPFETVPMFNLSGAKLPEDYNDFNMRYIDADTWKMIRTTELKNKLSGLIAYVKADSSKQGLKVSNLIEVNVEMSPGQYKQYLKDYAQELEESGFTNKHNIYGMKYGAKSSFHSKTFEDCLYWNPYIKDKERYRGEDKMIIDKEHCPKIIKMYNDSKKYKLCVFYFHYVRMYGVDTMEQLLIKEGYTLAGSDALDTPGKRYVLFTGNIPYNQSNKFKHMFNDPRNKNGEYIKYLLLSPSGAVGLTLRNVRYLGIGSAEFSYSTIRQILGRCNRLNSHIQLPEEERTLDNYIYLMTKNNKVYKENIKKITKLCERTAPNYNELCPTIERCIYQDSLLDDMVCESYREIMREVAI